MIRIAAGSPAPAPRWAVLQRYLIEAMNRSAEAFVERYTHPDGTLIWRDAWPGMDGSDDGYESFGNFALFHLLGGSDEVQRLARVEWDAVTRQFTGYGQVYREFDAYYDWMHHGESYTYLYHLALADPSVAIDRERAVRFAGMYIGEDEQADNWDAAHKLIRSPITGSRGPRFVNSFDDWVTHRPILAAYPPPFEDIPGVRGPLCDWNDDAIYGEVLKRINERMMRGDVPLNLTATSLVTHAYLYTGEDKHRQWVLDYTAAWRERAEANGGILPDNVGPNGIIGECNEGKWWGGYYGYRWPHGVNTVLEPAIIAASNCLLLTGDASWLDFPREQLARIVERGQRRDGRLMTPRRHGDSGWYDDWPLPPKYHLHLWNLSRDRDDWDGLLSTAPDDAWLTVTSRRAKGDERNPGPWVRYLQGRLPDYPETVLTAELEEVHRRLEVMRHDTSQVDDQDVHHWQQINPVATEALVQLTLGAPQYIYHGGLLHCRLRYFDPDRRRAGLPADVAALVSRIEPELALTLVNLDPVSPRRLILQAGAYGEHRFDTVTPTGGEPVAVGAAQFEVELPPGGVLDLGLTQSHHVNPPRYGWPWGRG